MSITRAGDVTAYVALSDALDVSERLRRAAELAAERAAYERGQDDEYERGWVDAILAVKAAEHGIVADLRQHLVAWDGLREDFGKSRPTDYPGGPLPGYSGLVWLAGPVVHRHRPCTDACRAYKPGWYTPADAAAVLATLPGNYPGLEDVA